MRLIWETMKIIVEPSCSIVLAAVLKNKKIFKGKKVGLILSGGNVDLDDLPRIAVKFKLDVYKSLKQEVSKILN